MHVSLSPKERELQRPTERFPQPGAEDRTSGKEQAQQLRIVTKPRHSLLPAATVGKTS